LPRHNDNATSAGGGKKRNQHHRGSHSSRHGRGWDRKLKAAKQMAGNYHPEKKNGKKYE
jgi:hypothetical protein